MPRVSSEQLKRLQAFFDTLPAEQKGKCALCNETLTHIVKRAEAEVGLGTATVTSALAEQINEAALPADRVTGGQLRDRVRRAAGEKSSGRSAQIKKSPVAQDPSPIQEGTEYTTAFFRPEGPKPADQRQEAVIPEVVRAYAKDLFKPKKRSAILVAQEVLGILESIPDDDPDRYEAFNLIRVWMDAEEVACRE